MSSKPIQSLLRNAIKYSFLFLGAVLFTFFVISCFPIKEVVKPIQPRQDTQYWTLSDGNKIAFTKIEGDSLDKKPPIIFLHGGPGGYIHSSIIEQMKILSKSGYDIYLYDQIGSGLSSRLKKPKDYSLNRHVSDLKEIVTNHIKSPKVILIGQSWGACLAVHFIANKPLLVEKAIFTSPGDLQPMQENPDGTFVDMDKLYPKPDSLRFRYPINTVEETDRMLLNPKLIMANFCAFVFNIKWASDKEMDAVVNTMATKFTRGMVCDPKNVLPQEGGGGGYSHIFSNWYVGVEDPRPKIKNLNIPVLVLQGECDQSLYGYAYEYVALFPNGRYQFIKNAGHIIWWEQPSEFISAINTFLISR
jgi:pimeloyl-ACP methyl ester carboxylesterase